MPVIQDLITFLKQPFFTNSRMPVTLQSFAQLGQLLGLAVALVLFGQIIFVGLYMALEGGAPEVSDEFERMSKSQTFVLSAVLLAPVIEELFFRSWHGRVWGILLVMPVLLCMSAVLGINGHSQSLPNLSVILTAVIFGGLVIYMRRYAQTRDISGMHDRVAKGIYPYIFWGTAVIFALMHVSNFAGQGFRPHMALLVMPQFIVGVILGYVRMRFGILQAIGFHAAYNAVFVGFMIAGQNAAGFVVGLGVWAGG